MFKKKILRLTQAENKTNASCQETPEFDVRSIFGAISSMYFSKYCVAGNSYSTHALPLSVQEVSFKAFSVLRIASKQYALEKRLI